MSETGDELREIKKMRQEKRWNNYESSLEIMKASGIYFEEKPNGHLIVYGKGETEKATHDFWLTTGLFIRRDGQKRGRGVKNLIRFIKGSHRTGGR